MHPIDWAILILVIYNAVSGLFSGLWRSLTNLAALVCAFLLTPILKGPVTSLIESMFEIPAYLALPVGTSLTWTLIYVVISILGLIWMKTLEKTPLKIVDRLGGLLLGLFISAAIVLVPLAAIDAFPILKKAEPVQKTLAASTFIPMLNPAVDYIRLVAGPAVWNYWLESQNKPETTPSPESSVSPSPVKSAPVKNAPAKQPVPARKPKAP